MRRDIGRANLRHWCSHSDVQPADHQPSPLFDGLVAKAPQFQGEAGDGVHRKQRTRLVRIFTCPECLTNVPEAAIQPQKDLCVN
jgi:hypothetical protein